MEYHVPVLLKECIDALRVKKDKLYFDGTLGGGGHSGEILRRGGTLIATDLDQEAIAYCQQTFGQIAGYEGRYRLIKDNFKNYKQIAEVYKIGSLDGAILDLGVSSNQIDNLSRGFSYAHNTNLDMRMDASQEVSALLVVNEYLEEDLARIIFAYGEERHARRIAKNIVEARKRQAIETTGQLADIVKKSVPYQKEGGHPAKRTFQAIRIEVNQELKGLREGVEDIFAGLTKGGRLCVISFHSLEDRTIKNTFRLLSTDCICDKSLPVCVCGHKALGKLILKKAKAAEEERVSNTRSKSATLRIIEKL